MRYLPIPDEIASEARATLRDRFDHRLKVTTEAAPCRSCLRISRRPEELILLSYQPSPDRGPYAEIGPIFIHARECRPYAQTESFPADFAERRLVLRAYGQTGEIVDAMVAPPGTAPDCAARFFEDERVVEIHARHESYTCFDFKIVRE
jgi:hypothetical protein